MIAIGEAARQSGVAIETIRYYERAGIVPKPGRGANGRRAYTPEDVARLRFVRRCRDLGFSMAEARALLRLEEGDCESVCALTEMHLDKVRRKIAALQALEAELITLTERCTLGATRCPMLDELTDAAAPRLRSAGTAERGGA